jgi:hypothetical protein
MLSSCHLASETGTDCGRSGTLEYPTWSSTWCSTEDATVVHNKQHVLRYGYHLRFQESRLWDMATGSLLYGIANEGTACRVPSSETK